MSGIILTFCAFGLGALAVLALPPFSMPVLLPVAFGALAVFFVANWALVYVGVRCLLTH